MTAAINRPLTDREKSLLTWLTIRTVAVQTGDDDQAAADALDHFTETGEAQFEGDAHDAYVVIAGHPLVHMTRECLAFYANAGEWEKPA